MNSQEYLRGDEARPEAAVEQPNATEWFRVHPLSPLISGGAVVFALAALVLRILGREAKDHDLSAGFLAIVASCVMGLALVITGALYLSWRKRWFAVDAEFLYSRSGGVNKATNQTRLTSVGAVNVERSILARVCGLASLRVLVQDGESVEINYVPLLRAQELRRVILAASAETLTSSLNGVESDVRTDPGRLAVAMSETPDNSSLQRGPENGPENGPEVGTEVGTTLPETNSNASRLSSAPRRVVDLLALEKEDSVVYELERKRSFIADVLTTAPFAIVVVPVAIGITVLAFFTLNSTDVTFFDRGAVSVILVIGAPLILSAYGCVRYLTRFSGSQVRYADGTISLKRGLFVEYSSMAFLDRTHWIEITQPVMWRGRGWWRLRIRSLAIEGDEDNEDGAEVKPKELLLPVADTQEITRILDLFESASGVSGSRLMSIACRDEELAFRTSARARILNPLTFGHSGSIFVGNSVAVRTGRFSTKLVVIPFGKVQEVEIEEGPLQRVFGLGSVLIDGAGNVGKHPADNLDAADARDLFDEMKKRIATPVVKPALA